MSQLERLLEIDSSIDFKIHAACYNGDDQPLDVFLRDREEWNNWTAWFNGTHDFNRPFVISLMDFYHERDAWLFGGIYKIKNYDKRPASNLANSHAYDVELSEHGSSMIGRLKISLPISRVRKVRLKAENYLSLIHI